MNVFQSREFKKSLKKILTSGKANLKEIEKTITLLMSGNTLPAKYKDHALIGDWKGYRECHIRGDLLLIYRIEKDKLILVLVDIGSHAQLFE
jgi:mRNA interferase YafQ